MVKSTLPHSYSPHLLERWPTAHFSVDILKQYQKDALAHKAGVPDHERNRWACLEAPLGHIPALCVTFVFRGHCLQKPPPHPAPHFTGGKTKVGERKDT